MQSGNNPTPIQSSSNTGSATAVTIPPMQAASTRNPKVILVAGLGILALIMVAVFGIIAGIKKGPAEGDLATGDDYQRDPLAGGSAGSGMGPSSTGGLTSTLPGSGLIHEQPQTITANPWPNTTGTPAPGSPATSGSFATGGSTLGTAGSTVNPGTLPGATTSLTNPWDNPQRTLMDPPAPTTTSSVTSTSNNPARTGAVGSKRYTVRESDTLWKIAQAHLGNGANWKRIVAANPGLTPQRLRTGMTINLPDGSTTPGTPGNTGTTAAGNNHRSASTGTSSVSTSASAGTRKTVTVKSGDTLYAIARREYGNGELWGLIYRANQSKIPNPHNLPTGLTITLPAKPSR